MNKLPITPELKRLFVETWLDEVAKLLAAAQSANSGFFKLVAEAGHRLKGNGGTYGYPQFSRVGEELERRGYEAAMRGVPNQTERLALVEILRKFERELLEEKARLDYE